MADPYRRYPPPTPGRRWIWWLIAVFAIVLVANLIHQGV
jgi:cytochrome c-type biogenesis protein CcmH/NrfF